MSAILHSPAASIIAKCGGSKAVARITGAHCSRVSRWQYAKAQGGTGGVIPHAAAMKIIFWAKKHRRRGLGPSAFMKMPSVAA